MQASNNNKLTVNDMHTHSTSSQAEPAARPLLDARRRRALTFVALLADDLSIDRIALLEFLIAHGDPPDHAERVDTHFKLPVGTFDRVGDRLAIQVFFRPWGASTTGAPGPLL